MSETVAVLRFENERGLGPYNSGLYFRLSESAHVSRLKIVLGTHIDYRHPTPYEKGEPWWEVLDGRNKYPLCGFADLDQLTDWFDDEAVELLLFAGYRLVQFTVPRACVSYGRRQACFNPGCSIPEVVLSESRLTEP